MFTGSIVATVTPMKDGAVDEESLRSLLRMHAEGGTAGIVPAGCTGEAATLSSEERLRMLSVCLDEVGDTVPIIPGTGSNSTTETLHLTRAAAAAGAHGALIITPYYNKPTPAGMYLHYREIALEVDIPIVLYNVPSRTGVNMLPETVARLSELENIVAIKEASGSIDQVSEIAELCDITILSGDDPLTLPMMSVGAAGVVSVVANVLPRMVSEMVEAFPARPARALELHHALRPISKALFFETSPGPIKYAMAELGLIASDELRPPLAGVTEETKQRMSTAIAAIRSAANNGA